MIKNNLHNIIKTLPVNVQLIAVSKTKPVSDILSAYNAGQRAFGENKIQEMVKKHEALPKDIEWHMIGHLQRNKVKYMAPFVHLIHGVDSLKTLIEINKQALKHNRIINCLLEIKIAEEETKFGLNIDEIEPLIESDIFKNLKNIKVSGFMGMASFTNEQEKIKKEFSFLKSQFDIFREKATFNFNPTILSMGMSGDYKIAIKEGSTMVRIGSAIFGSRNYTN
ncbi:MAG: YggS family pyridoxal phosphate-dependent enzyme [Lutibacter sp.]